MHTPVTQNSVRVLKSAHLHLLRVGTCLGLSAAVWSSGAMAQPQAIWVARGANNRIFFNEPFATGAVLGGYFDINYSAGTSLNAFKNLMFPNAPGSTSGQLIRASQDEVDQISDLVIANDLHSDRTVTLDRPSSAVAEFFVMPNLNSLRLTTQGDVNVVMGSDFSSCFNSVNGWLVRDPQSTGIHRLVLQLFRWSNVWIGGSGHLELQAWRPNLRSNTAVFPVLPLVKMGPGTMVYNPLYSDQKWPASDSSMIVRDGTVGIAGPGVPYIFNSAVAEPLQIGAEYGGVDYPPNSVPPASWSPFAIPPVPPAKNPRVVIQADNVVPPGKIVRMGSNSVLRFEAPEPISFLGTVVSDLSGSATRIECKAEFMEAVSFDASSLSGFRGVFRVEGGVARLYGAPNGFASFVLAAPQVAPDAVLELAVPSGDYAFMNQVSGLGRIVKSGTGTLSFSGDTAGFSGEFMVAAGTLLVPSSAAVGTLRNTVSVTGPTSVLSQLVSNAIADNTAVSIEDSGRWLLNGRSDTISRLRFVNNARLELGGGTLTLSGGVLDVVHIGGTSTATIAGPGTLASTVPLAVNSFDSLAPIDLDIQATLAGPSVLFTGPATVRLAGSGAAGPALTVQGSELRLARTGVNAATGAVTIGDVNSGLPFISSASVVLEAADQLPDNKTLTMNVQASLNLNGFTDTIGGLAVSGVGPFSVAAGAGELVLAGNASFSGNGTTTISGPLNMLAGSRNFTVNTGSTLLLTGTAYSGTINKLGSGALRLDALDGYFTLNNSGFSTSVGIASFGGLSGDGSVRIDSALTVNTPTGFSTAFGGAINGAGSFTKSGPGWLELNSGSINNYTGPTRVEGGTLFLNRFPGTTVIPGNITIASGGTLLFAGGASNEIADAADVTVETGGTMTLDGQSETIRNLILSGTCTIDKANGTPGMLTTSQTLFVAGGTLDGRVGGGALSMTGGRAHVRGTLASVSMGLVNPTLAVGGFVGADQLTINGAFSMPNSGATIECTVGQQSDPALIRALGSLSYPLIGNATVRVRQTTPAPFGTSFSLIDFGTGGSSPNLSKYTFAPITGSGQGRLTLNNRTLNYIVSRNPCAADTDGSGGLSIDDVFVYLNLWFGGGPGADFNLSGSNTIDDIFIYLNAWFAGC